jgi:phosphatidylinositol alpha-1,6-mannosyltransferase
MRLLITEDFPPKEGGLQSLAYELARNLHLLDGPITVLARKATRRNRIFDHRLSFPVWRMGGHDWSRYGHVYVAYYLAKFLLTQGIKPVVYATHWKVGLVPALLAPLTGMKVLIGAHGMEILKETKRLRQRLIRLAYCRAHRGMAVSQYTRHALIRLGVPPEKVAFVPNGVDVEVFRPREKLIPLVRRYGLEDKKVILTLARLVPRKGQDQVIRALPQVLQEVPNVVYLLAGEGGDEARLRTLVRSLGLAHRVHFTGYVPSEQLVDYYNLADVYIMTSREIGETGDVEGFGITFLEASACQVPVIGGRSGGIPNAVVDGDTGILVDPEDTDQIASALLRVLTDELYARRLGREGRRRVVGSLQWHHMARRCLQLERESVDRKGGGDCRF